MLTPVEVTSSSRPGSRAGLPKGMPACCLEDVSSPNNQPQRRHLSAFSLPRQFNSAVAGAPFRCIVLFVRLRSAEAPGVQTKIGDTVAIN